MECPKCKHQQEATDKCESCGVYFSKVAARPAEARPARRERPRAETPPPRIGLGALGITALVTALLVIGFMRKGNDSKGPTGHRIESQQIVVIDSQSSARPDARASRPMPLDIQASADTSGTTERPLEAARNATVLIETGLGVGSGFIIDGQCHVVTNRHVVELNGAQTAEEVVRDPEAQAAIADAREKIERQIYAAEIRLRSIRNQAGSNLEQVELERRIAEARKQLEDPSLGLKNYVARTVDKAGRSGFTATLPDGTRYESLYARFSEEYDLALFKLPAKFCSPIRSGRSKELSYGQRLYTIGNPSGMAYTLTSGVYSGERFDGETRYLQTDAPINPGNSGGPLITEDGRVVGINSMVLRDTQGIGFALPIEAAYDAFPELGTPE
jgi:S1-C subfamily serine protease